MESQRWSIDSQIKTDCATNHHDDYKTLRSERCDAGPHMDGNKQPACRSGHRKPNAFQDMGKFSHAGSHRRNPRIAKTFKLGHFSAVWKTLPAREPVAQTNVPQPCPRTPCADARAVSAFYEFRSSLVSAGLSAGGSTSFPPKAVTRPRRSITTLVASWRISPASWLT